MIYVCFCDFLHLLTKSLKLPAKRAISAISLINAYGDKPQTYEINSKIFVFSLFSEGEKLVFAATGEVFLEPSGRAVPSEQIRQLEAPDQPDRSGGSVVIGRGSNLDP